MSTFCFNYNRPFSVLSLAAAPLLIATTVLVGCGGNEGVSGSGNSDSASTTDPMTETTGETVTVREFVQWSFEDIGIDLEWRGEGINEKGYEKGTGRLLVEVDERYFRPTEVDLLLGDPTKAKEKLGWVSETPVRELAREMVQADLKVMKDAIVMKGA